ncbi:MAG TPA: RND transporter, partial [Verrucomicrobiota bacterium]|nr:RND transporter [Verrucomicrobiota bacterium]
MKPADSAARNVARDNSAPRRRRRWLPVAMGLVVAGAIIFGLWPKPIPVETAVASKGRLRATVNEEGRTRVRNRYMVASPITGQLRRITLDPGDPVAAGKTVVAVLDPVLPGPLDARSRAAAEARRASAVASVEKARVAHDFAQTELARFEKLFRDGAVAIQDLDAAKLRAEQAARELASAEGHLKQVEAELTEFGTNQTVLDSANQRIPVEITAPANGCVLRVFEKSARVVTAGTP